MKNKFILFVAVPILAIGLAMLTIFWFGNRPAKSGTSAETFVIPQGSSLPEIASSLKEKGFVRSPLIFEALTVLEGNRGKIQAGSYQISASDSPGDISTKLTKGTNDVWVTIPEGLRAEEIGEIYAKSLPNFDTNDEGYKNDCLAHQGHLFPDTYLFPKLYTAQQVCEHMHEEYDVLLTPQLLQQIQSQGKTEDDILIMASILQREAKTAKDMKIVAGILNNRLDQGIPLQVDATLQYAKGYDSKAKTWWPTPTSADKELNSPYNTYKNKGLPPGPISNPGEEAIMAAISPTPSNYLYYISDSTGAMHYSVTYDEHLQNIDQHLK